MGGEKSKDSDVKSIFEVANVRIALLSLLRLLLRGVFLRCRVEF